MLNQDYTAKLLNLEDVIITNVENISGQLHISLELPRAAHVCPACGGVTDVVQDYRKRRYSCACGTRFFEQNAFLPRYYRVTNRLVSAVAQSFRKVLSAKVIGSRYNISSMTAMLYFILFCI